MSETCSKLTKSEQSHWHRSGPFFIFERNLHIVLVLVLLILNK